MFGAIGSALGAIFGSKQVVEKGMETIDKAFYTDQEKAEDAVKSIEARNNAKIKLLDAYAPFKLAQRYLAFMFAGVFVFIMLNGVLGALYGWVEMSNVKEALSFANKMYLGEIMSAIILFYFGAGFKESWDRGKK